MFQVPTVSDWVLLTCTKKKHFYSKHKTTNLKDVDDDDDDENKQSVIEHVFSFRLYYFGKFDIVPNSVFFLLNTLCVQMTMGTSYGTQ